MAKTERIFLDTNGLAERWGGAVQPDTIAKWRIKGTGPRFMKLGSRVVYALDAVEAWEEEHMRQAAG
jgi:hypothetical protein